MPLYLFSLGIEAGQAVMVVVLMSYDKFLNGDHSKWNQLLPGAGFGVAVLLSIEAVSKLGVNPATQLFDRVDRCVAVHGRCPGKHSDSS